MPSRSSRSTARADSTVTAARIWRQIWTRPSRGLGKFWPQLGRAPDPFLQRARLLLDQGIELLAHVLHLDFVVGLLPQDLAVRRADDETVAREAEFLAGRLVLLRRCVEILAVNLAFVFLIQPAHGGLDLRANGSAGEVVVGHFDRRRLLRQRR